MKTEVLKLPNDKNISAIAGLIKNGEIAAIPTETVYGLAANALDAGAVNKIFAAKGRQNDNPLIVHIGKIEDMEKYAVDIPQAAHDLAQKFWPGPLTIILKKNKIIPDAVTAGLDSVALRMPDNKFALDIINAANLPLAAPSANISGSPSPTKAGHVYADLNGRIPAIADGGECEVGIESTVISLVGSPRLLRPGKITPRQIEEVIGEITIDNAVLHRLEKGQTAVSPGMKYRHYAPKATVILVNGQKNAVIDYINLQKEENCAVMCFDGEESLFNKPAFSYGDSADPLTLAHCLFSVFREIDKEGVPLVFVRAPDKEGVSLAVYNRLVKASNFTVIEV